MSQPRKSRTLLTVSLLVILGLTAGLGLGLLLGWVILPVEFVDTTFSDLGVDHQENFILLVASAYTCDGDLAKAQARLDKLDAANINAWIQNLVDDYIIEERDEADIRALVELARGLGATTSRMATYLATPTPPPTNTPLPTPIPTSTPTSLPTDTPNPPTDTPVPPTDTPLPQPTDSPVPPTDTSVPPTDTPVPPTNTAIPPTNTAIPPTNTPKPQPTNTPQPPPPTNTSQPPVAQWTWTAWLVGPGQDAQTCESGNLQIRATIVDANNNQIGGVWLHDYYSGQYQVTGNVTSPDWGPGETKFEYGVGGGGKICVASGEGGGCVSDYSRDMPCYYAPPFDDLWASGYCNCCEPGISQERCRELYNTGAQCMVQARHYSWRLVFKRSW